MDRIIRFGCIVLSLLSIVNIEANYQCGIRKHFIQLIYHGWKIQDGHWPWHVGLYHKTVYACGGTLIDESHILTAAHCVVKRGTNITMSAADVRLHLGQRDRAVMARQVQERNVGRIHVHPQYGTHRNDIAVLELESPVEFTDFVLPICWDVPMDKDLRSLVGQRGWIAGWGMMERGRNSDKLRSASLPVVSYLQCLQGDQTSENYLNENVFCAGDRNGTSPGTGDSGGGMYFSDGDRWILRGIVSFAEVDETQVRVDAKRYAIFVNVQRYFTWIRDVMKDRRSKSAAREIKKRISEKECDRFKKLAGKGRNGLCSNANRYPHTVSLYQPYVNDRHTGVIVNENHVLTACSVFMVFFRPAYVRIVDYEYVNISNHFCHPAFNPISAHNDVAILRLATPLQLSQNIVPACLANVWTENLHDTLLTTGFRITIPDTIIISADAKNVLRFFKTSANQVISAERCNRDSRIQEGWILKENGTSSDAVSPQLCVINNDPLLSDMWRSNGSPMQTFSTRTCMFTVVGVVSYALNRTEQAHKLQVYTRVAHYLDWIEEIVWGGKEGVAQTTTTARPVDEPTTKKFLSKRRTTLRTKRAAQSQLN